MSNHKRDFSEKEHHLHSGVKYSGIGNMDKLSDYKNGNCQGDQNQNSIDARSDSVCPLTTTVLLSHSGKTKTKTMEYRSEDHLDYRVAGEKAEKYKRNMFIFGAIAILMTAAVVVMAVLLGVGYGSEEKQPDVCTSTECVTAASRILNSMDRSIDPCEDFFTYACGKWNMDHVIPEDKSSVSTFNDVRDSVSLTLKRVLETDYSKDRSAIQKAKIQYSSCMDTDEIDSAGGQPAYDIITKMGGMPLFGDPLTSFELETALAKSLSEYGSFALLSMWIGSDDKNSSVNIIQVDQPSLGMPSRDYYTDETRRNATLPGYSQFMRDYLGKLWKDKDPSGFDEKTVLNVSNTIIELETEIANAMMKSEDRRDSFAIYKNRSISAMDEVAPDFDWLKYINACLDLVGKTVEDSREIVSYGDYYFSNFTNIINKYDDELIQNYLVWMVLRSRVSYLGKDYRDTQAPYRQAVSGTSQEEARWKTCSDNANANFNMPVGALFVEAAFPERNKKVTEDMVENIRESFLGFLPDNDWMDEPTKKEAENKANMIRSIIAYPDYILDESDPTLDEEYEDADVKVGQYFSNMQTMVEFTAKKYLNKLDVPVNRDEWITGPAVVNAFYSPTRNQIVFPAGILQPPFYDPGQPNSMNYGGIGMVIGHEITHGFDDSGSQYNGIGNLDDWWSESSRENFNVKAKCMEDQYSGYYWEDAESNLNGKLTLGENIADNGGIREAFDAYQTWKSLNGEDLHLPGLSNYTQEQLFFLSMAQVWCGVYRPEYAVRLVATDPHSPGIYRVIGSLSNFEEFGKAYQCSQGTDTMYPKEEDTCRVW